MRNIFYELYKRHGNIDNGTEVHHDAVVLTELTDWDIGECHAALDRAKARDSTVVCARRFGKTQHIGKIERLGE